MPLRNKNTKKTRFLTPCNRLTRLGNADRPFRPSTGKGMITRCSGSVLRRVSSGRGSRGKGMMTGHTGLGLRRTVIRARTGKKQ